MIATSYCSSEDNFFNGTEPLDVADQIELAKSGLSFWIILSHSLLTILTTKQMFNRLVYKIINSCGIIHLAHWPSPNQKNLQYMNSILHA